MKARKKSNWRAVIIAYLVAGAVVAAACVGAIGTAFREKLALGRAYGRFSQACAGGASRQELAEFARWADVEDVLLLDGQNQIRFSARGTMEGVLALEPADQQGKYLCDPARPGVYYHVIRSSVLRSLESMVEEDAHHEFEDEFFYLDGGAKKVYALHSLPNGNSGQRVFLIFSFAPVKHAQLLLRLTATAGTLFFMLYWALVALYVYRDAERHKLRGAIWGILALFTNLAGLLIYAVFKQLSFFCFKCQAVQNRGHVHCDNCGARLHGVCAACGKTIEHGAAFCPHCGKEQEPAEFSALFQ
ncbi:MAG: zinc ribbon domain-containing protein [Oscillospiraceae bacterium]|jgi:hypothetical protein|nr:zinc ribbon domain-containing protein [Oscillospiraceae bacterium]